MPGGRISSPSSPTADMSWVACGDFEHVEFAIFFLVFLAGLASNILFVLFSFRKVVDAKGCFEKPNPYVVQWSMANLVILVFFMPLDILSFTTSGSWFFGRYLCRLFIHSLVLICSSVYYTKPDGNEVDSLVEDSFVSVNCSNASGLLDMYSL